MGLGRLKLGTRLKVGLRGAKRGLRGAKGGFAKLRDRAGKFAYTGGKRGAFKGSLGRRARLEALAGGAKFKYRPGGQATRAARFLGSKVSSKSRALGGQAIMFGKGVARPLLVKGRKALRSAYRVTNDMSGAKQTRKLVAGAATSFALGYGTVAAARYGLSAKFASDKKNKKK